MWEWVVNCHIICVKVSRSKSFFFLTETVFCSNSIFHYILIFMRTSYPCSGEYNKITEMQNVNIMMVMVNLEYKNG